jgi:hypothetical protein
VIFILFLLFSARGSWQLKLEKESSNLSYKSNRYILFILGGMSYSEMRSIYEVYESLKVNILMASTSIWTPVQFMEAIGDLTLDYELEKGFLK